MNYKDKLDRIFSEYIRLRDADNNGYIRCISCGKIVFWKDTDMYFSVVLSEQEVDELIKFLQHKKEIMKIGNE